MGIGIIRRDFMNGIAIAVTGTVDFGSFEAAHRLRDGLPFDITQTPLTEHHDLIAVSRRPRAPDRDVAAITVNRWPHGHAYTPTPLYDDPVQQARRSEQARRRLGRIAIANSDSGWDAYTHVAIDQAHRAVAELSG